MKNQSFILHHVISQLENRLKKIDWSGLKVHINQESKKDNHVSFYIRTYDLETNIYQNINDQIRVGTQLIPRSLPVDSNIVIFCVSNSHENQLKAIGVLLQAIRDNRKMEVGDYNWLNNENSPLTIDSVENPDIRTKMSIKEHLGFRDSLPLFFKISSCIDSQKAQEFVEVQERKVHMVKKDA